MKIIQVVDNSGGVRFYGPIPKEEVEDYVKRRIKCISAPSLTKYRYNLNTREREYPIISNFVVLDLIPIK